MADWTSGTEEDRNDLRELVVLYSRCVDRRDLVFLRTLFHSDATMDYGEGYNVGSIDEWLEKAAATLKNYGVTQHQVTSSFFRFSGDQAEGETYFTAYHVLNPRPGFHMFGGRYLDRFERRNHVWRFIHRNGVTDWDHPHDGFPRKLVGKVDRSDPSYSRLTIFKDADSVRSMRKRH
jgi:SnoaL-like domain